MCVASGAKPAELVQVVPRDSPHTTCSIFPALPKAAQLCWLKNNLPPRLLQGQRLAGCGLTRLLWPAGRLLAHYSPPGSTNVLMNALRAFIVCQGLF